MPIFEFHCKQCRNEFKTLRRLEKLDGVTCPDCGSDRVARLLSVTARTTSDDGASACALPAEACCRTTGMGCGCRG